MPLYKTRAKVGNNGTIIDVALNNCIPNFEVMFLPRKVIVALKVLFF